MIPDRLTKPYDLAAIYRKYYEFVFKFCYRKTFNVHDAEDLTQDVFALAFRQLETVDEVENFWSWIFVIAKYRVFRFWKYQERKAAEPLDEFLENDEWQLCSSGISPETAFAIDEGWNALAMPQKRAFYLTKVCGFNYSDAAEIAGATYWTTRTQSMQATERMQKHISRY